ncbi:MAG: PH domain-containing protein [Chloroflexota bacterium]|nr:PH domain-containing protein [Chloroflexota bacterium]
MSETHTFHPARRIGQIFHLGMIALLVVGGIWGLLGLSNAHVGPIFLLYLLPSLLTVSLGPYLVYRLYTLQNASYTLERNHFRLQWGWRVEIIPTNEVQWIRPAADLKIPLRFPLFHWPGAIVGTRRIPGGRPVEFMASQKKGLLLIGTEKRIFAISLSDPDALIRAYGRIIELGSLNPSAPQSIHPSFLFARVWKSPPARYILLIGTLLGLGLLTWISLSIPNHPQIHLGFTPTGAPREPLPGIQLMLLPVFNTFVYLVNSSLGLFFYRNEETHAWAYLLWITTILVSSLFLLATYFILRTG